ncbi:CheR family methyltransferase [uncultured Lamprocystis sp.]|jgi:chemotaxis protein methyltransferase CheR|uniref:CheR family methyltransferase n=1 Tax=uncultured Lamprocystis sp. TaxID=543132 RepID=UPI0025F7F7BF|nr:CheR family methyltransferase [uncultured Lamprocystis sp.]
MNLNLTQTKALIRERLGLHFDGHQEAWLQRAVKAQMAALGTTAPDVYLTRLREDAAVMQALTSLLTIKETYFYREPHQLRLLTEHLAPLLLRTRDPDDPIRILSVGCATGEEPYSVAIALRQRWGEQAERLFEISAADVDERALDQARSGRYRSFSFRAMPDDLIARWFTSAPDNTRLIAPAVRRQVRFRPLNLLAEQFPDDLVGHDLIFYRNLSIYFDAPTRAAVLGRLSALLRPGGYLIVGTAETLANDLGVLPTRQHEGVWFFARQSPEGLPEPTPDGPVSNCWGLPTAGARTPGEATSRRAAPSANPDPFAGARAHPDPRGADADAQRVVAARPPAAPREHAAAATRPAARRYQEALGLARAEQVDAALACLAPLGVAATDPESMTLRAHLLLERGDLEAARTAARQVLIADAWSVDALVLLGRSARAQGDLDEAVDALRRAIYQRPEHWPAHYQLAECHRNAGRGDAARREYRIVLRQLADARAGAGTAQTGPLPSALSLTDLRLLCEARLHGLADAT